MLEFFPPEQQRTFLNLLLENAPPRETFALIARTAGERIPEQPASFTSKIWFWFPSLRSRRFKDTTGTDRFGPRWVTSSEALGFISRGPSRRTNRRN